MAAISAIAIAAWQYGPNREPVHAKHGVPTLKLEYKLHSLESAARR
jgi:hypothetical protein